ncbi:MAG: hypothetical protein LBE72_03660, partial [Rickettsia sp.]|nr:hypothetical protein [Rickettsia sp.]
RGFALRDKFADALGGLITVEEAQDYQVVDTLEKNVTPITKTDMLSNKLDHIVLGEEEAHVSQEPSETLAELIELVKLHNVSSELIYKWCIKAGVESIADLGEERQTACIEYITRQYNYSQDVEAA